MKQPKSYLYEGIYIISARLSEEARAKALARIEEGITSRGGEVQKVHEWGRRRLAYETNGHREGYYYVIYFNTQPANISDMWADYHLNEDLVRFMTLRATEVKESLEFQPLAEAK